MCVYLIGRYQISPSTIISKEDDKGKFQLTVKAVNLDKGEAGLISELYS